MDTEQEENVRRVRRAFPIDVFLKEVTYLPFEAVQNICATDRQFRNYCMSPAYSEQWRILIENTYRDILYNYENKIKQIREELGIDTYDYRIYVALSKFLDPVTQVMILYKQGDLESANKYTKEQRFLAKFLMGEKSLTPRGYQPFNDILDNKPVSQRNLDHLLALMAAEGNIRGIKLLQQLGANVRGDNKALEWAAQYGRFEAVKYLLDQGVDINIHNGEPLIWAAYNDQLDIVNYLIERGADVNMQNSRALIFAAEKGHLRVVQALINAGSNVSNLAIDLARNFRRIEVVRYLAAVLAAKQERNRLQ